LETFIAILTTIIVMGFLIGIGTLLIKTMQEKQEEVMKMEAKPYAEIILERLAKGLLEDREISMFCNFVVDSIGNYRFGWKAPPEVKIKMITCMMNLLVQEIDKNEITLLNTPSIKS
jgi:hypothetical protein